MPWVKACKPQDFIIFFKPSGTLGMIVNKEWYAQAHQMVVFLLLRLQNVSAFGIESTWQLYLIFLQFLS